MLTYKTSSVKHTIMLRGDDVDQEKLVIYPKRGKGEDGYKTFSIRIKDELAERLNEISTQTGRSRNELIGKFLEYALEHCTISEE